MKLITNCSIIAAFFVSSFAVAGEPGEEILGQWYTDKNASKVDVVKKDGKYFGTIIWLEEPVYGPEDPDKGVTKHDRKNPKAELQKRPIIGLLVLQNFTYDADDKSWSGGTIYDPEVGKTYRCVIRFQDDPKGIDGKSLHVRGYLGAPIIGRTTVWYRVPPAELEKNTATAPAKTGS